MTRGKRSWGSDSQRGAGGNHGSYKRRRFGMPSAAGKEVSPGMCGYLVSTLRLKETRAARELATVLCDRILVLHPEFVDIIKNSNLAENAGKAKLLSASASVVVVETKDSEHTAQAAEPAIEGANNEAKDNNDDKEKYINEDKNIVRTEDITTDVQKKVIAPEENAIEKTVEKSVDELDDHRNLEVEDQLAKEIAKEKSGASAEDQPLTLLSAGYDCLMALRLHPAISSLMRPSEILPSIFDDVREKNFRCGRFVQRCIPFDAVCSTTLEDIIKTVKELSKDVFGNGKSFAIHIKLRRSPKLTRDTIISSVAEVLIAGGHKVNLTTPEISVVIEVIGGNTGIAVISGIDFLRCRKFNFHEVRIAGEDNPVDDDVEAE